MKNLLFILALFGTTALLFSCNKAADYPSNGVANMKVYLTSSKSTVYDAVNVDIRQVQVYTKGGVATFTALHPGVYNLKTLNGIDTLLADGSIPAGSIESVRILFGPNNSIKLDGVNYPLTPPSEMAGSGTLNINRGVIADGSYSLYLDFDPDESVIGIIGGGFAFRPTFTVYDGNTIDEIQ